MDNISPVRPVSSWLDDHTASPENSQQDHTSSVYTHHHGPSNSLTTSPQESHKMSPPHSASIPQFPLSLAGVSHASPSPVPTANLPISFPLTSCIPANQSHPDSHPQRPSPPPRSISFQKRHASFDSPREVPLPSPSLLSSARLSLNFPQLPPSQDATPSTATAPLSTTPSIQSEAELSIGRFHLRSRSQTSATTDSAETEYAGTEPRPTTTWSRTQRDSNSSADSMSKSDFGTVSTESLPDPDLVFEDDVNGPGRGSGSGSAHTSPEQSRVRDVGAGLREKGKEVENPSGSVRQGNRMEGGAYDVVAAQPDKVGTQSKGSSHECNADLGASPSNHKGKGKVVESPTSMSGLVFPLSRPFSLPASASSPVDATKEGDRRDELEGRSRGWIDRSSSASLPLPAQIPYHTLPRANTVDDDTVREGEEWQPRTQPGASSRGDGVYGLHLYERPPLESQSSTESSDSSDSLPSIPPSPHPVPGQLALSRAAFGIPSAFYNSQSTLLASRSFSSPHTHFDQALSTPLPQPLAQTQSHSPRMSRHFSQYSQRTTTNTHSYASSSSSSNSSGMGLGYAPSSPATSISSCPPSRPSSSSGTGVSRPNSFPPPEPPVILPPENSENDTRSNASLTNAPYGPFLCRLPPPPDSWIEVETTASEYKLNVRLPGFRRECITLATKRRRILHVVADSWEQNGGHFERRISFGYDADLTQVRAEFDGTMLKVSIPRRLPSVSMWNGDTLRPMGRLPRQ